MFQRRPLSPTQMEFYGGIRFHKLRTESAWSPTLGLWTSDASFFDLFDNLNDSMQLHLQELRQQTLSFNIEVLIPQHNGNCRIILVEA